MIFVKRSIPAGAWAALAIVVLAILARCAFAAAKTDFHVDEGFSVAITSGGWMPLEDAVVHNRWLSRDEVWKPVFFGSLIRNGSPDLARIALATGQDVHPPLFYWAYATLRALAGAGNFAIAGYALNLVLFAITCALLAWIAWAIWKDWVAVCLVLALCAFSSTSVSLTLFIRMYELLQTVCVAFLACALLVLFPRAGKSAFARMALAVAGLCATSFAGILTHYYFLFFLAPVAAFSALWLLSRLRISALLWSVLAVAVGLYLAYRIFPQMAFHLTESYRARQSTYSLTEAVGRTRLSSVIAFAKIVADSLVSPAVLFAAATLATVRGVRMWRMRGSNRFLAAHIDAPDEPASRGPHGLPLFVLFMIVSVATFFPIALSAPYRSARYIAAFFPVYALAFASFAFLALPRHSARALLGAAAILVAAHGLTPSSLCAFHEDYSIDGPTGYMRDSAPIILMSTGEGSGWKNILVYVNLGSEKRLYVAEGSVAADMTARLGYLALTSGSSFAYALVENQFAVAPAFEKIGYYGFFTVYRIPVE